MKNPQWIDHSYQFMIAYNHKLVHSSAKMLPAAAVKKTSSMDVK
jgi:hypothetical protein